MIRDHRDVRSSDLMDLEEVAEDLLDLLNDRERRALDLLKDALERRTSLPWREIEEVLESDVRANLRTGRTMRRRVLEVLLSGVLARGWALLPPAEVRRICGEKLTEDSVKMRAPRVKTLRRR